MGHFAGPLVEVVPSGVAPVVVHVAFAVGHDACGGVVVDPFAAV